jgi:hypothetical protein
MLIAMVLACCLQPLLGGPNPVATGTGALGIVRLNLLGYVPLLAALGLVLREARLPARSEALMIICGILIAVSSLHPRLTYNGLESVPVTGTNVRARSPTNQMLVFHQPRAGCL